MSAATQVGADPLHADPRLVRNRDTRDSLVVAAALTGASYVVGIALGWISGVDPLEAFAVFTSYSCTYLCVRQRRVNYLVGALSTVAYCVLFWRQDLLASALLNAYLTPSLVYGWYRWRADLDPRPVSRVALRWLPAYGLVTAVAVVGAIALTHLAGGAFAVTDGIVLVGSVLAQFLMDNKKIENWVVWFVVDVVAIWQYVSAGLAVAGLQYVFFLANAVWAFVAWRRTMRVRETVG